jgi:outer membrane protein assembly factor BamE (lipoprotein component of BamABCDE complex)
MDLVAWDDVKEGMTKEEVVRLLGEPVAEVTYVPTADEKKSRWVRRYTNRYQYVAGGGASWTAPLCWDPHPDAYVIRFDKADRVVSWSTPEDRSKESIPGR